MGRLATFDLSADAKLKLTTLKGELEQSCGRFVSAKEIVEHLITEATTKKLTPALKRESKRKIPQRKLSKR